MKQFFYHLVFGSVQRLFFLLCRFEGECAGTRVTLTITCFVSAPAAMLSVITARRMRTHVREIDRSPRPLFSRSIEVCNNIAIHF